MTPRIGETGHRSIERVTYLGAGIEQGQLSPVVTLQIRVVSSAPGAGVRQRENRGGSLLREHDAVDERVCPEKIGQIEVGGRGMTVEPI